MIDLHTHSLLSDGELLPSELARRAYVRGYSAIAITDHVDSSNIDFIVPRISKACKVLNKYWDILVIPGVEITHAPIEEIGTLVRYARKSGARIVVVHGETVSEPVIEGTNCAAIEAGCDILAHPGNITIKDARLAAKRGVYLEITTRKSHRRPNKHVVQMAIMAGADLVLDNDAHKEEDFVSEAQARALLRPLNAKFSDFADKVFRNSLNLVRKVSK